MLHVVRHPEASLQTILEENLDSESQGSMETIAETTTELSLPPPFCGGAIFNVSVDSPSWEGETEEDQTAHVNRNVNHAQRQANEATLAMAEAQLDSQGRPCQLHHNLDDEFVRGLARLPQTPEVAKVAAMLKVAHCQVNEIRQDQRPSYSTSSIRRSTMPRSDHRPSRFTNQHRDNRQPLQGGARDNRVEHLRQHDQEVDQDV